MSAPAFHRINYPTTIYVGAGLIGRLKELPHLDNPQLRGRALLVTDRGLARTDIPRRIREAFAALSVECVEFSEIETNPVDQDVEAGVAAYRAARAEFIIGLGGGSPLDVAKTIAVRLHHPGPLEDYDDLKGGDRLITGHVPPVIAIPTTAGTGSEVSRSSVIHIKSVDRKVVIFSPRMMPVVALLDPELTTGLPDRITAFTGIDALTHLIESYVSLGYHPIADGVALEGIRIAFHALPRAYANGNDIAARRDMLMASLMGAVAFQKGLGAAHSMAHPLSSICGLHHGQANAHVLYNVMEFNRGAIGAEAFARLSFAAAPHERPGYETFMKALQKLLRTCNIPETLSAVGVRKDHVEPMSKLAIVDGCHATNPRPMTEAAFRDLFAALV